MSVVPDEERLEKAFRLCRDPAARTTIVGLESRAEGVIMMFWYDHNMGWWGYAGMGIGMVLFWALIVAGIVAVVVFVSRDRPFQQQPPTPEQILAARFARGEISETEYRDRLAILRDPVRH